MGNILIDFLLKRAERIVRKNEDRMLEAMGKVNEGGDMEDIDTIVTDYFWLTKKMVGRRKPSEVKLDGHNTLIVDGVPHVLYEEIRHNDSKNTERYMEIEALFSDRIPAEEVEQRLNERIRREW